MMPKRIILVGASARAAAFSALRAGWKPETADLFADCDLQRVCPATRVEKYPQDLENYLLRAAQRNAPVWMYTGALESYPDLVERVSQVLPLLGTSAKVLREVRDPFRLAGVLRQAGFQFPESVPFDSNLAEARKSGGDSWLWKPLYSSGGQHIRQISNESQGDHEELDKSCLQETGYLQKKIFGRSYSAVFLAANRRSQLLGVTEQLHGPAWSAAEPFAYAGSVGPIVLPEAVNTLLQRLGETLCKHFDLRGLFGVDFILEGETIWPLEINPRYTASVEVLERGLGIEALSLHFKACQAIDSLPPACSDSASSIAVQANEFTLNGKAILYAHRDVTVSSEFEEYALGSNLPGEWPEIADIPAKGTRIFTGQPITTLFAEAADAEQVKELLQRKMTELRKRFFSQET